MATFFAMPKLGLNMTHGVIVDWLVAEGDRIEEGTPVLEVETDKATQEVEAPASGILAKIIKVAGDEVPCNHVIAVITAEGEAVPDEIPVEIAEGVAPKSELAGGAAAEAAEPAPAPEPEPERRISISPSARKLAEELGVDITQIKASGRIKRADVEAAHAAMQEGGAAAENAPGPGITVRAMSTLRRKTAEYMDRSARTVARVGLTLEVDAAALAAARQDTVVDGKKVSYNVLLARKAAEALTAFPYMNAQIREDEIWEFEAVNIGIAMDTDRGLLVPVLQDAAGKDLETLQREFNALTERALAGHSTLDDLQGGTFTITNLGGLEIESFLPVVNLPECAILGVGAIIEKPVVVDGEVTIRPRMKLTLAFDHRLVDGAPAARFLQRLKTLIEQM
jgi:pyruvate dehydrogenase E2 component (dihydrolipoamide acetyltransferase)